MKTIYFACGFSTISVIENLVQSLEKNPFVQDHYSLVIPQLSECDHHSYVFSDLYHLDKADILVVHISDKFLSIGASMELSYFKTKYPHKLAIGYKCTDHGWINHFTDIRIESPQELIQILETFQLAHKSYT